MFATNSLRAANRLSPSPSRGRPGWGWVLPSPTGNPSPPNPPLEGEGLTRLRNESMNAQEFDILIIGGGHNGLVCAAYLAAAGLKIGRASCRERVCQYV